MFSHRVAGAFQELLTLFYDIARPASRLAYLNSLEGQALRCTCSRCNLNREYAKGCGQIHVITDSEREKMKD
jgi:hypothetical protein